jgi:NADH dehydrogenase
VKVRLVDRRNYHLFQPLLYQVTTAGVSPEEVYPVRGGFRKQANLEFVMAEVSPWTWFRIFSTSAGFIPFDYLILAVGRTITLVLTHWLSMPST